MILESLRLASIITFTFREAVEDVDYEGTCTNTSTMENDTRVEHGPRFFRERKSLGRKLTFLRKIIMRDEDGGGRILHKHTL